jgi:hypothetical protein
VVKVLIYIEMLFIFSTPVSIRYLWQLKTVVFLHWCLIRSVILLPISSSTSPGLALRGPHSDLTFPATGWVVKEDHHQVTNS